MLRFLAALAPVLTLTLAACAQAPTTPPVAFVAPAPARVLGPTQLRAPALAATPAMPLTVKIDITRVKKSAPGIEVFADHAAALCREWYPVLCAYLAGDGFVPRKEIALAFVPEHEVPAYYAEGVIVINVAHLRKDPTNYGMVLHELVHAIQAIPNAGKLKWLTEGIADYARFYIYEVDPQHGWIRPGASQYTDSYRTTAAFLDYLVRTYDPQLVKRLNTALRQPAVEEKDVEQIILASAAKRAAAPASVKELFDEFITDWSRQRAAESRR